MELSRKDTGIISSALYLLSKEWGEDAMRTGGGVASELKEISDRAAALAKQFSDMNSGADPDDTFNIK